MTWLTAVNLLLKVAGGILDHLREGRLIQAGADAEQVEQQRAVAQSIKRARRAVQRARVDAHVGELRDKYRRR